MTKLIFNSSAFARVLRHRLISRLYVYGNDKAVAANYRPFMRLPLLLVFVFSIFLIGGAEASAEEPLDLLPYPYGMDPPPDILAILKKKAYEPEYKGKHFDFVLGAPIDIDLDGEMELVVSFAKSEFCGSAGCSGLVLKGSNQSGWRSLAGISTGFDRIFVSKERINGFRVLFSPSGLWVWNGAAFAHVCTQEQCRKTNTPGIKD